MLEPLFNSESKEQVLIFLIAREEGYATEIARFFETDLFGIQNQLDRLEGGGILVSKKVGRTRVFTLNPRYALIDELKRLLEKALSFYPEDVKEILVMNRRRPKMRGRPE
jgi:predicted transcriptional regulator